MDAKFQKNSAILLRGIPVSRGIVMGRAVKMGAYGSDISRYTVEPDAIEAECDRLAAAIDTVHSELETLQGSLNDDTYKEMAPFINLHAALVADPSLKRNTQNLIREKHCNAEWALDTQGQTLSQKFQAMEEPYFRERAYDITQVIERIQRVLSGYGVKPFSSVQEYASAHSTIVVARDISPADLVNMREAHFAGFVTAVGGSTSHTSIVAHNMKIPAIVGLTNVMAIVQEGDLLILDGFQGVVIVNPSHEILRHYQNEQTKISASELFYQRRKKDPAVTLDGQSICVQGNIEHPDEAQGVLDNGGHGIGLFRSEFLFMGRSDSLPSEEEQYEAYKHALSVMGSRPVVIRTLDLGSDKMLSDESSPVSNPALGLRGIRYCLARPEILITQLRALYRASVHGNLRILVPMVSGLDEMNAFRTIAENVQQELSSQNLDYSPDVQIGAMIEVPAAVLIADRLLSKADFLSIGTNDLIQYTLAIDRVNNEVSYLFDPLHPAVLSLIHKTIQSGHKAGKKVSVCGEMAGDFMYSRLLLGLGLTDFSMSSGAIPEIKHIIRQTHVGLIRGKVASSLNSDTPLQIDPNGVIK